MTRKRTPDTRLQLTREAGYEVTRIAGRDEHGEGWMGLDATKATMYCAACGTRIQYGYAPLRNTTNRALCVKCVAFVDADASVASEKTV